VHSSVISSRAARKRKGYSDRLAGSPELQLGRNHVVPTATPLYCCLVGTTRLSTRHFPRAASASLFRFPITVVPQLAPVAPATVREGNRRFPPLLLRAEAQMVIGRAPPGPRY